MKIFAISDLHLTINSNKPMDVFGAAWDNYLEKIKTDWQKKVTDEDVVLIAGDISWAMKLEEAVDDLNWIGALPGRKIIIRGNHDYWWKSPSSIRNILPESMYLIQNDSVKLGSYVFSGTRGWTVPEYKNNQTEEDKKIYDREVLRLEMSLKSGADKLVEGEELIAMIHYPPFNSKLEDNEFTALFEKYAVKKVIYGHLHGTDGKYILKHTKNDVTYYLTSCDIIKNTLIKIN
jgi:predicted phosphohydrolase